ncbi:MAG: hypothetical protein KGV57_02200 [Fusobacterium sp.]|nr:hypothetical protein [Fusobacterium sp.]
MDEEMEKFYDEKNLEDDIQNFHTNEKKSEEIEEIKTDEETTNEIESKEKEEKNSDIDIEKILEKLEEIKNISEISLKKLEKKQEETKEILNSIYEKIDNIPNLEKLNTEVENFRNLLNNSKNEFINNLSGIGSNNLKVIEENTEGVLKILGATTKKYMELFTEMSSISKLYRENKVSNKEPEEVKDTKKRGAILLVLFIFIILIAMGIGLYLKFK